MGVMRGNLISLEPLDVAKHAAGYFEVSLDENIHRYTGNSVPKCVDEVEALLRKYEEYFINWIIIANDTQKVIGIIRLGKPEMENGILIAGESEFLSSQYWRKGHMKEAKQLFYAYVFEELSIEILYADAWAGNTNSIKSLESYGYKLIETKLEVFSKTGKPTEKHIFSLSKNDYYLNLVNNAAPKPPSDEGAFGTTASKPYT